VCRVYSFSFFLSFFFSLRAKKTGALILSFKRKQQSLQEDYKRPRADGQNEREQGQAEPNTLHQKVCIMVC
jgi:hypothetical protein